QWKTRTASSSNLLKLYWSNPGTPSRIAGIIETVRGALLFENYAIGSGRTVTARWLDYTDAWRKRKDVLRRWGWSDTWQHFA
ncbi:MAG: hypothetical protein WBR10_21330, partial [Candidatus Acidiferrum sp.]